MTLIWPDQGSDDCVYAGVSGIFSNFEELIKAIEDGIKELKQLNLSFSIEIYQNVYRREFAFILVQTDDKDVRWWEFAIKMADIKKNPNPLVLPLTSEQFHNLREKLEMR